MTTISSRVFAENPIKYLNMANTECVVVKRGKKLFWIRPEEQEIDGEEDKNVKR